jgi:signal transduction histidine kinase
MGLAGVVPAALVCDDRSVGRTVSLVDDHARRVVRRCGRDAARVSRLRASQVLLWAAGGAVGVGAEWSLIGSGNAGDWIPDLVTGWTLIACGLVARRRWPESGTGALLGAVGFAWFVPNFASGDLRAIDWVAAHALYLHRGPLVQLTLTYPRGRASGRVERTAVAAAWTASLVTAVWRSDVAAIFVAMAFAAVATARFARSVGHERRLRSFAAQATTFVALAIVVTAAARAGVPTSAGQKASLLVYEAALCLLAIALLVGLARRPWESAVTDLVVDLGGGRSGTVRDALARALGDPQLRVGYWLPERQGYVDAAGQAIELAAPEERQRVTRVEWEGQPVAALVHDASVAEDPLLVDALATAARLASTNARLHARLRAQVDEVIASRRRLVEIAGDERKQLAIRLRERVGARGATLLETLERTAASARTSAVAASRLERARTQLAFALDELHELAAGLHPRAVADLGLAAALVSLAERSPVPVRVEVTVDVLPSELAVAAYFVCSEALANVVKHAAASSAAIVVTAADSELQIVVEDDGIGGASVADGTGLRGIEDRVETLGGTFRLISAPGSGTTVQVAIPHG